MVLLRLLGFVAVVVAGAVAGNLVAATYGARTRQLTQFRVGLHLLQSEVTYALGALPGALERVAFGVAPPVREVFGGTSRLLRSGEGLSAGEAWERVVRGAFPKTALEAADLEVVLALSGYLGVTDRDDQMRHLGLAVERLEVREEEARAEQQASERMWRYLGLLGGLAAAVVLL